MNGTCRAHSLTGKSGPNDKDIQCSVCVCGNFAVFTPDVLTFRRLTSTIVVVPHR